MALELGVLSDSYPDSHVKVLDSRFAAYVVGNAALERIATGFRWAEGPVWFGDHNALVWSDIPNNRQMRWDARSQTTSVHRAPSDYSNGNTRDRQGRQISCEHGRRRVTRTEYDGSISVVADQFEGKPLNSPNDVVVASDGSIWFTDPAFGIHGDYEGHRSPSEVHPNVYRVEPDTWQITLITDELNAPNGLAFSEDESILYVVDSFGEPNPGIWAFDVAQDRRSVSGKRPFIDGVGGSPDGFRLDEDGNLWCGWAGNPGGHGDTHGVRIFTPEGDLIGAIELPEPCANVVFGAPAKNRLFMTAGMSVYALYVNTRGLR